MGATLDSYEFNHSGYTTASYGFAIKYDVEPSFDKVVIEESVSGFIYTFRTSYTTHSSGNWVLANFPFNAPAYSSHWVSISFVSDNTVSNYPGAFVDDFHVDGISYPDLTDFWPFGWARQLIVTEQLNDSTEPNTYYTGQPYYMSWGVQNQGTGASSSSTVQILVDNVVKGTYSLPALNPGQTYRALTAHSQMFPTPGNIYGKNANQPGLYSGRNRFF